MTPATSIRHRLWPLGLYRVSGASMRPTYQPGDTLLGWRWLWPHTLTLRPGAIVVVMHQGRPLIKRLHHRTRDGRLWLLGDNPAASTDSRHFGSLDPAQVVARIILHLG